MKLQKILSRFLKLHKKEIDLSLDRIIHLCEKLGNPQDKIEAISIVGTNGKNSTIQACYSILKEAGIKCNVYTSPHIQKINERFVFNNQQLGDDELASLFEEVERVNANNPITFFEILTACFFHKAAQYPDNLNLIEAGLFHRFDATNILKNNLASIVTSISKDHLDWLPENERTIDKIIFEKTSNLLNSNIIVAKQYPVSTLEKIKKTIHQNQSNKYFFNDDFSVSKYWKINGKHYAKTCRHWLQNHYANKRKIIDLFDAHYDDANKWYQRWRLFFLACEMLFAHDQGNEWFVSHYLLEQNK